MHVPSPYSKQGRVTDLGEARRTASTSCCGPKDRVKALAQQIKQNGGV
jgi:hypothetical protein